MQGNEIDIKKAFICSTCTTKSIHRWYWIGSLGGALDNTNVNLTEVIKEQINSVMLSKCDSCDIISYWHKGKKIYPQTGDNPPPNIYLSDEIQEIYNEANSIANLSDRATRILLRVALEKLLTELGIPGEKLYDKIQMLYDPSNRNNQTYEQSEIIRLLGNDAAHAERLVNSEEISTEFLFKCINLIAERLFEQPQKTSELHNIATQIKNRKT